MAAEFTDECRRLIGLLPAGELRQVAQWTLEGADTEQVAGRLGRSKRDVQRKLKVIRSIWCGGDAE
jgi:hypothetical protein